MITTMPSMITHTEPISSIVEQLLQTAIQEFISDIHLEPQPDSLRVRFRKDGLLYQHDTLPKVLAKRIITRIKIIANLDIAIQHLPQDGRATFQTKQKQHDLRISCYPTIQGEKIAIRILNHQTTPRTLEQIGLTSSQYQQFLTILNQPQGLIIVTGPTGSGKTNTLYAALQTLNQETRNIVTIEDPIEIQLSGINQSYINRKTNLNFASMLRSLLRQDPDVVMIGEIRDEETADIAIKAAQTGHLVLTTLHTNSAAQAITRLNNMGIKLHNIFSALKLITGQRLLRMLCNRCKITSPNPKAIGCNACHQGYHGRLAIHELIAVKEQHLSLFQQGKIIHPITTLQTQALNVIKKNLSTKEEMTRVLDEL